MKLRERAAGAWRRLKPSVPDLRYREDAGTISFKCVGLDEGDVQAPLFDEFLLNLPHDGDVFVSAYRLWSRDDGLVMDPDSIAARAESRPDRFRTFFRLNEARIHSGYLSYACEIEVCYFSNEVGWEEFLACRRAPKPRELIEAGLLTAIFQSVDHGADLWFIGGLSQREAVLSLIDKLSKSGWIIERDASALPEH